MNAPAIQDQMGPDQKWGALFLGLAQTILVIVLSYLSTGDAPLLERSLFSVCLSTPVYFLASRGHFGQGRWRFPSIPGLTYLVWNAGLAPSLVPASSPEIGVLFYGAEAKWTGALGFLVWFMAFAVGAAKISVRERPASMDLPAGGWRNFDAAMLLALIILWVGLGVITAKAGAISTWSPSVMQDIQGTGEGGMVLLYLAFTPLVP